MNPGSDINQLQQSICGGLDEEWRREVIDDRTGETENVMWHVRDEMNAQKQSQDETATATKMKEKDADRRRL